MNVVNATLYDFAVARQLAHREPTPSLPDVLSRIDRCCQWLAANGLAVIGFTKPLFRAPYVTVSANPAVYCLFSGRCERVGYKKEGTLRYEVWEAEDRNNHVAVRWVEVIACA